MPLHLLFYTLLLYHEISVCCDTLLIVYVCTYIAMICFFFHFIHAIAHLFTSNPMNH